MEKLVEAINELALKAKQASSANDARAWASAARKLAEAAHLVVSLPAGS